MSFLFPYKLRAAQSHRQKPAPAEPKLLGASLTENLAYLRGAFADTSDFVVRRVTVGGRECALLNMCAGKWKISAFLPF